MSKNAHSTVIWLLLPLICVSILLTGCGGDPGGSGGASRGAAIRSEELSAIELPFSGESVMGELEGEPYRYFRYDNANEALVDKAKVSADGKMIGDTAVEWGGPVHFYYFKERIVIYVGDNASVIESVEKIFGPQFAGD